MKLSNALLIRTKLMPPRVGIRTVQRDRLLAQLEEGKARTLALLIGPAGSGKTTLAVQWRQSLIASGCDVGWYSLGPEDDAQWSAYLIASLENAGLATTSEMVSLSERCNKRSLDVLLPLVINALYEHARPIYLFLEDLQFLAALPALAFIQRLIELAPDNFHLVITSRQRPGLDIVSIGIKGQLTQIGFSELRLTLEEQACMLTQQGVSELSRTQHRRLYKLTDGWAAGLQLTSLSLRNGADFEGCFQSWGDKTMATDLHGIERYLDDCLARVLTLEQIGIMVRISICRRFDRELCVALTGDARCGEIFDILLEQNLFLVPIELDGEVQWYRFHQMFSGYLGKLRSQVSPAEMEQINLAASEWFAKRQMYVEAIRHAQYAGDITRSVELLLRAARTLVAGAHFAQLLQLVNALPRRAWSEQLDLLLAVGWAELTCHRMDDFRLTYDSILAHPESGQPENDVERRLLHVFQRIMLDDTEQLMDVLTPLLEHPPHHRNFLMLMLYVLSGHVLLKADRAIQVRDLTHDAQRILTQAQGLRSRPFLDVMHGLSFHVQGDLRQAKRDLMAALTSISRAPLLAQEASIVAKATLSLTLYGLDDLDAAEDFVEECLGVAEVLGTVDCVLYGYVARAKLQYVAGMPEAAHETLEQLGQVAERLGLDRVHAWRYAEQVRMACGQGDLLPARESMRRLHALAEPYVAKRNCALAEIPLMVAMAQTSLALAEGEFESVVQVAERWVLICQDGGQLLPATVLRIRAAIAHAVSNAQSAAHQHLLVALRTASECGMNRVFLDEGRAALKLLESLPTKELSLREQEYLERCLARVDMAEPTPMEVEVESQLPAGGGGLSPRELEIVTLLARALSTKSVARELNLSPGTVKWHLKNVFGKLNAYSREDAVTKARSLGLLP